jgi:tetratricopeptide (TPR) repeat protein
VAELAVRAARRAVLASPDHPDGYYFLGLAYADVGFAAPSDLQDVVWVVSLARARARIPDTPTQFRPSFDVVELGLNLAQIHRRNDRPTDVPRLDLSLDGLKLAHAYLRQEIEDRETALPGVPADSRDAAEKELENRRRLLTGLEQEIQSRDTALKANLTKYLNETQTLTNPTDRAAVARRYGLVREAITELRKAHEQFQKQLQDRPDRQLPPAELAVALAVHAELIELLWYDGQVEEAARILDTIDTPEVLRVMESQAVRQEYLRVRQRAMSYLFRGGRGVPVSPYDADPASQFRNLRRGVSMIVGDFERAKDVQVQEAQVLDQQLAEQRAKYFPTGNVPNPADLPDLGSLQRDMALRPALVAITAARMVQIRQVNQFLALSTMRAEGRLGIALTYLEWGDVPRAAHYLKQAEDAPGWTRPIRAQLMASDLLKAIERAGPSRGATP